jgi:endonuclease/exonuclease/phosphatase family metal-dependent hydrolase
MRRALVSGLMLAVLWPAGFQAAPPTIRVLTYNIHHGEGMDGRFDLPRIAAIIKSVAPDLVALQEVDLSTNRSGGVNQLAELVRLTEMHAAFGKTMNFDGGGYGVAVLSRWPVSHTESHPLPGPPDLEPRSAFTMQVKAGADGPQFQFTVTHLDQGREQPNRLAQATALNDRLAQGDVPAVMAGDINARVGTETMNILDTQWTNASVLNIDEAERARLRGDFVLYRPAQCWRVIESRVIDDVIASDHRPVLAVLEWTGGC